MGGFEQPADYWDHYKGMFEAAVVPAAMLQQGRTERLQLAAKMKKIWLNGRGKGWN